MTKKRTLAHRLEMAINTGATAAEKLHQSIAEFPLKFMEDSAFLEKPAARVRHLQAQTIGAFYDLMRDANRRVAKLLSDLLRGMGKRIADARRAA